MLTFKECRPLCRSFFYFGPRNVKRFYWKDRIRIYSWGVSQAFCHLLSSHRYQQGLWLLFCNAISIRKRLFTSFFLKFAGFVWTRSVSLSGVEKVSKSVQATKIYLFIFLVFWQTMTGKRNRTPWATIPARYSEIIIGDIPLSFFWNNTRIKSVNYGDFWPISNCRHTPWIITPPVTRFRFVNEIKKVPRFYNLLFTGFW